MLCRKIGTRTPGLCCGNRPGKGSIAAWKDRGGNNEDLYKVRRKNERQQPVLRKCGSPLVTETAAGHTAVPVRSETSLSQLVGWLQKYGRHIMRVAALLAVVLFFCPLFLVSCEGVQMNVSGFQTATGFGFDDDGNTKSSWFLSEEDNSRYYTQDNASLPQGSLTAFAALLLAGGMLGSTFVLAQNASKTEQKNVHGAQIALAAAHVAALFYIFERLKRRPASKAWPGRTLPRWSRPAGSSWMWP